MGVTIYSPFYSVMGVHETLWVFGTHKIIQFSTYAHTYPKIALSKGIARHTIRNTFTLRIEMRAIYKIYIPTCSRSENLIDSALAVEL